MGVNGGGVSQRRSVITLEGCDPKAQWHRAAKLFRLCLKPRSLEKMGLWLLGADWLTFAHENRLCFPQTPVLLKENSRGTLVLCDGGCGLWWVVLVMGGLAAEEALVFRCVAAVNNQTLLLEKQTGSKVLLWGLIVVWDKWISYKCQYNKHKCILKIGLTEQGLRD